jgi:hypothetical protein
MSFCTLVCVRQVPLFLEDESVGFGSFIKRGSAFGMGGWWLGGTHMVPNPAFLAEVQVGPRLRVPTLLWWPGAGALRAVGGARTRPGDAL